MAFMKRITPISRKELEEGTVFDTEDIFHPSSDEDCFDDETSNNFISEMEKLTTGEYSCEQGKVDLSNLSIEELKEKMQPLTDDKKVLKLVIDPGTGLVLPEKSIVLMHYNASVENVEEPFDSTYRRGKPHRFLLNAGYVIPGLDIAVSTMRKGEVAKIWVASDYAYGAMGCPPRIPPNANIVYNVEILSFIESKEAIEFEDMAPEDQKKAPFHQVYSVTKIEHQLGNEMCKNNRYFDAVGRYQKARRLLEDVSVADEEQDKKRIDMLLKIYLNLSLCYLKMKKARRVIFFCRKALDINEHHVKALFRLGNAYLMENEFDMSRKYLLKAKEQEPYNADINKTLLKLEEKRKKVAAWEKDYCKKMFGQDCSDSTEDQVKQPESHEFIQVITDRITKFMNSEETEYSFSSGFTPTQIDVIESIAQSHGLVFVSKIFQNQKIIKVLKKKEPVIS